MSCDSFQEKISALLDKELEAGEAETLFKHLAECHGCRGFLEKVIDVRVGLNSMPQAEVLPSLDRRVRRMVFQRTSLWSGVGNFLSWLSSRSIKVSAPVAALFLFIVCVATLLAFSFWQKESAQRKQPTVVYIMALEAIEVEARDSKHIQ